MIERMFSFHPIISFSLTFLLVPAVSIIISLFPVFSHSIATKGFCFLIYLLLTGVWPIEFQ